MRIRNLISQRAAVCELNLRALQPFQNLAETFVTLYENLLHSVHFRSAARYDGLGYNRPYI